ncbi:hypothetical protein IFM89_037313 [Coptis chinensis]|uniref:Uncharacterized protein n=1 Tax=Coptis chinensis TaxID=261450 RepID=A0A835LUC1_9MAGN|nr:hypothetical protein IFM89_037313 [Coptis chinensis]
MSVLQVQMQAGLSHILHSFAKLYVKLHGIPFDAAKFASRLWGYIYYHPDTRAAVMVIRESVEPLWEEHRPPGITSLKFSKLSLGSVVPKIEGLRNFFPVFTDIVQTKGEEVTLGAREVYRGRWLIARLQTAINYEG